MTASAEARDTALIAAQAAADKLATDVMIVDVSERLAITDAFVLASAPNERQVQSIVDEVEERLREHGVKPVRREGVAESRWVLLDFVDIVVHVQHAEERAYYALERLWKDCPVIPFVDRALPGGAAAAAAGDGGAAGDSPAAGDGGAAGGSSAAGDGVAAGDGPAAGDGALATDAALATDGAPAGASPAPADAPTDGETDPETDETTR